LVATTNNKK
jgi:hypothetical protein